MYLCVCVCVSVHAYNMAPANDWRTEYCNAVCKFEGEFQLSNCRNKCGGFEQVSKCFEKLKFLSS